MTREREGRQHTLWCGFPFCGSAAATAAAAA
eukprot:CAMPEP_0171109070 /NCGR_PEP_ID=MMETSP0766_2-20121228/70221_1 /TAXON_ID=439317 /ORGANISM="Gambierdiscus australes, Strain CAWD 149" /LENGTH=30 /DNA_ID= /DNA_START= /DNA_END= /DNA_ORIENTATION=